MEEMKKNITGEEKLELGFEELEGVTGGAMTLIQKAGVVAAVKMAKLSGYTLEDMEYIFETARRADAEGHLQGVTAAELEAYIRAVWVKI